MVRYDDEEICQAFLAAIVLKAYKDLKLYRKREQKRELGPVERRNKKAIEEWLIEYAYSFSGIDGSRIVEAVKGEI